MDVEPNQNANSNINKSSLTYKTRKVRFQDCFLAIFVKIPLWQPMKKQHETIIILLCGGSITANKNLAHESEQKLFRAVYCLGSFAGLFPSSGRNYL